MICSGTVAESLKEKEMNMGNYNKDEMKKRIHYHVSLDSSKRFIGTIYQDMEYMDSILDYLAEPFRGKVDAVAAPAVAGYVLGAMLARELKVPFVPIMRCDDSEEIHGEEYLRASYLDHRDSVRSLKIRKDAFRPEAKVLLVDNWIETAATITACQTLLEEAEAAAAGITAFGLDRNLATDKLMESGLVHVIAD